MIHPATRLVEINQQVGFGVVATKPLPAGTLIWVKDPLDVCLQNTVVQDLPRVVSDQFRRNAYLSDEDHWILCWDIARFVNHGCDCNVVVSPYGFEIACRDIAEGEQITNDYALFNLATDEEFDCACGALHCRQRIDSKNVDTYLSEHEFKLRIAVHRALHIDQPLWSLMAASQKEALKKIMTHET